MAGPYAGVGPGAHGRLTVDGAPHATRQIKAPALWLKRVAAVGHGTQEEETLTPETRAQELVMVGLRLAEGLDKARFARLTGQTLDRVIDMEAVTTLIADGYLADTPARLTASQKGRLALNAVLRELLA
jgi:oxygen-independent coproporphyrinogen-3 oxidase